MISMEERINPASALCTAYMCFNMWIDHTQRTADRYSRIDDMNSSDARANLTSIEFIWYLGKTCSSDRTVHIIVNF